ncbi:DNA-binding transcriptional response regulator, NtrC family, contains REC, AAA-type ATPase, and a Fis-type DNA-binding domains [Chelatococcus sambhunathii]|uniref:Fis family transcriptional regulator n=2 Tax=Chelatococcus TaxID=28209 RepID=A0AAC9P0Y2_9HYPH|nr:MULTISPECIES: sigma-54 dependent transcriptional regulator [Chelatococcus]APF39590.1 Fis family transcriptional regulator [Chelatococcus daeguensis]CUA87649.1 DNA-binding transcriptional response regulator, NtrC family, contains REC, AAA-type ATPase, and a Fis-type DNA-binding domains [Chelatococcus sambhunathii]
MSGAQILLADDEDDLRIASVQGLELAGFAVRGFASAEEVLSRVGYDFDGLVMTDIRMPGMDGMSLMNRIHEIDPDIPVVLLTGHADVQLAVRAMREGAYDFVEKPFTVQNLGDIARRALDRRALVLENRRLRALAGKRDDIETRLPGRSALMVDLRYRLRAIAATDADVLIVGDTGTGKEVAARALHDISARAGRPVVAINCAAMPAALMESELFGHEAGAFPGALRPRYGKFEHARGGTILLDEIGSMPLELQAKLLRVIQERVITRLGSNEPVPLDVRFIALSKSDLDKEVAAGRFRADLYYCLNVVSLRMPALAARPEDIPLLFLQLVAEARARYRRDDIEVPAHVIAAVSQRAWPGNVRELRNAADRFVLGLGCADEEGADESGEPASLASRVADYEKRLIASALAASGGALKPVYEGFGISRKTLYEKMQKYGLTRRTAAELE